MVVNHAAPKKHRKKRERRRDRKKEEGKKKGAPNHEISLFKLKKIGIQGGREKEKSRSFKQEEKHAISA